MDSSAFSGRHSFTDPVLKWTLRGVALAFTLAGFGLGLFVGWQVFA